MKISEVYKRDRVPVSFEIFPPKGELRISDLRAMLDGLTGLYPDFISVTSSAGGSGNRQNTAELAGIIQNEYGITSMAHLTCVNSTVHDIDEEIEKIRTKGIENILALRGDKTPGSEEKDFRYASELISYLKSKTDFCIGAGCYPEGHVECDDVYKDIDYLKEKENVGADFFISQLFFDNSSFYRFIDKARSVGITKPIDAGIMPIMGKSQITRMIFQCGASLPAAVIRMLNKYENSPDDLIKAGMDYAAGQIVELLESGTVSGIHIYSMNKAEVARYEVNAIKNAGF